MNSTLEIWQKLQEDNSYFKYHKDYCDYPFNKLDHLYNLIKDKVICELGSGYGRETQYLAQFAKLVYVVDVAPDVFLINRSNLLDPTKVQYILATEYKTKIPNNSLDYVRSYFLFQHILPNETQDYITSLYPKLKLGGIFDAQFLTGDVEEIHLKEKYQLSEEPSIVLTLPQIKSYFKIYTNIKWEVTPVLEYKNYFHLYGVFRK